MNSAVERKLRTIYEFLDAREFKKALKFCNSNLQKGHQTIFRAAKALTYMRAGQPQEAYEEAMAVKKEEGLEAVVLELLGIVFKGINKPSETAELYAKSFATNPNAESGLALFNALAGSLQFAELHPVSMKLYRITNDPKYALWTAQSMWLQVLTQPCPDSMTPICLGFLNKFKASGADYIYSAFELELQVLTKLKRYPQALQLLEDRQSLLSPADFWMNKAKLLQHTQDFYGQLNCCLNLMARSCDLAKADCGWDVFLTFIDTVMNQHKGQEFQDIGGLGQFEASEVYGQIPPGTPLDAILHMIIWNFKQIRKTTKGFGNTVRNIKRAALLAELELKRRLREIGWTDSTASLDLSILKYLSKYYDIPSTVEDLMPYLKLIESPIPFLETLTAKLQGLNSTLAHVRLSIVVFKLKKLLGLVESQEDLIESSRQMLKLYFDSLNMEEAPKKGEHRVGDELVLLLAEYLGKENILAILDSSTKSSPYNFFLKLVYLEGLQSLGDVNGALELYNSLDIKSVQHETMGYLRFRLLNDSAAHNEEFSKFLTSHDRFHVQARSDLVDSVQNAFKHSNFSAVLDFFNFKHALDLSYFAVLRDTAKLEIALNEKLDTTVMVQFRSFLEAELDFEQFVSRHDTSVLYRCGSLFAEGPEAHAYRMATRNIQVYGYRAQFVKHQLALWRAVLCIIDKNLQGLERAVETLTSPIEDEFARANFTVVRAILMLSSIQLLSHQQDSDAMILSELESSLRFLNSRIQGESFAQLLSKSALFLTTVGLLTAIVVPLLKPPKRKKKAIQVKSYNVVVASSCLESIRALSTLISSQTIKPIPQTELDFSPELTQAVEAKNILSLRDRIQRSEAHLRRIEAAITSALRS